MCWSRCSPDVHVVVFPWSLVWPAAICGTALIANGMRRRAVDFGLAQLCEDKPFFSWFGVSLFVDVFSCVFCEGVRHALGSTCMVGFDYVDWCPFFRCWLTGSAVSVGSSLIGAGSLQRRTPGCRVVATCYVNGGAIWRLVGLKLVLFSVIVATSPPTLLMFVDLHAQRVRMH